MNCREIKNLLSDYVDNMLSHKERDIVEKHLFTCKDCRDEYESLKLCIDEIKSLERVKAPLNISEKIHERLESRTKIKLLIDKLFLPFYIKIPLEVAALFLIALLIKNIYKHPIPEIQIATKAEKIENIKKYPKEAFTEPENEISDEKTGYENKPVEVALKPIEKEAVLEEKMSKDISFEKSKEDIIEEIKTETPEERKKRENREFLEMVKKNYKKFESTAKDLKIKADDLEAKAKEAEEKAKDLETKAQKAENEALRINAEVLSKEADRLKAEIKETEKKIAEINEKQKKEKGEKLTLLTKYEELEKEIQLTENKLYEIAGKINIYMDK
ncbi:MAG: zf-HC2 domain-containing protein [bacterium]